MAFTKPRIGLAAWALAASALAAPLAVTRAPEGYAARVWHIEDGLPEETVQAFAQTPDRFLWIGTSGGLLRFDGIQFVVYDRENTPALRENSVFCLMVAHDGTLWIGEEGGGLASYSGGVFRSWSRPEGLTNNYVRALREDGRHDIWVGTDDGLFRLRQGVFTRMDDRDGVPASSVHALYPGSGGRLWVGGYHFFSLSDAGVAEFLLPGGLADNVKSILETRDGAIWVGTVSGLERRPPGDRARFARVETIHTTVRSLRQDLDGAVWIGTIGEGLFRYRDGVFSRLTAPASLPGNTVLASFEDSERNIWIGTQTGLLRLSRTAVRTFPLPDAAGADFGTVYEDRDGTLWVTGAHLFRFSGAAPLPQQLPPPLAGVRVRNVFRDSSGVLWAGSEGQGVFRWGKGPPQQITNIHPYIRAFAEDRDGGIWIGTDGGYCRWRPEGIDYYELHQSIRALLIDRAGDLWVGKDLGLSRLHQGKPAEDAITNRLRGVKVWAIHEDPEGGMWFGTRGSGLFRWKQGNVTVYTAARGLASNSIYQILEDRRGWFWMSGPNGISVVSRHDLDRMAQDAAWVPAVKLYGASDGLGTTQMYGGVQPAGCITAGGEIWFPSSEGPVRIGPDPEGPAGSPPLVINRVVADGRDVPPSGEVALPPGGGKLEVHYSAIRLRSPERVRFKYKLEGFDEDWTEATSRRVASYTNVPPGRYRFRVVAFEMDQPRATSEASLSIRWRPRFYRAPWFYALCLVSLAGAVWVAHKLRMRQAHARFAAVLEERGRLAREMHDTLIQGCTGISVLLEAALSLKNSAPEMKSKLLENARDQVRATIDEARQAVWNLRSTPAAGDIGQRISEIAQQIGLRSGVAIDCDTNGAPATLDPETGHHLLLVVREALDNAVRHGHPSRVSVRLEDQRGGLRVRIRDDGCGFVPETASQPGAAHYGIVGMRERIESLGGTFVLESARGRGTTVEFTLPIERRKPHHAVHSEGTAEAGKRD
jgi:signal transduction histidine kinase/ligand-binding sensor domain-containing protein